MLRIHIYVCEYVYGFEYNSILRINAEINDNISEPVQFGRLDFKFFRIFFGLQASVLNKTQAALRFCCAQTPQGVIFIGLLQGALSERGETQKRPLKE